MINICEARSGAHVNFKNRLSGLAALHFAVNSFEFNFYFTDLIIFFYFLEKENPVTISFRN